MDEARALQTMRTAFRLGRVVGDNGELVRSTIDDGFIPVRYALPANQVMYNARQLHTWFSHHPTIPHSRRTASRLEQYRVTKLATGRDARVAFVEAAAFMLLPGRRRFPPYMSCVTQDEVFRITYDRASSKFVLWQLLGQTSVPMSVEKWLSLHPKKRGPLPREPERTILGSNQSILALVFEQGAVNPWDIKHIEVEGGAGYRIWTFPDFVPREI